MWKKSGTHKNLKSERMTSRVCAGEHVNLFSPETHVHTYAQDVSGERDSHANISTGATITISLRMQYASTVCVIHKFSKKRVEHL